jgi:Na+/H+ antiporter NhaA
MPAQLKKIPLTIFQRFVRTETLGSIVLLGFGLAALAIANSPLAEAYKHVWEIPLTLGIAPNELSLSLHEWINDGLMAVFFLLVALQRASKRVTAPVLRLENALHNFSAFVVMPLFAFANAGVKIDLSVEHAEIGLGVLAGLMLGNHLKS